MSAKMTIHGMKSVRDRISGMPPRARNMKPALQVCGERGISSIQRNFREGGRPKKWKPSQRARFGKGKTLIDTGRLRASPTYRAGSKILIIGTNVKYAGAHQFGVKKTVHEQVRAHSRKIHSAFGKRIRSRTISVGSFSRRRKINLPARKFLLLQKDDRAYNRRVMLNWVMKGKAAA